MDAEVFDFGRDEILVSRQSSEKSSTGGVAWANELRRVLQDVAGASDVDGGIMMDKNIHLFSLYRLRWLWHHLPRKPSDRHALCSGVPPPHHEPQQPEATRAAASPLHALQWACIFRQALQVAAHIRIPPEREPKPELPPKNAKANVKTSSASFGPSVHQSLMEVRRLSKLGTIISCSQQTDG